MYISCKSRNGEREYEEKTTAQLSKMFHHVLRDELSIEGWTKEAWTITTTEASGDRS
jgi:hypothetical protein